MAAKGTLLPPLKMVLKKYYPLPEHPLPVLRHPDIPPYSSPLPCTEQESLGNDQTESGSPKAPADGPEEKRFEIPLAVRRDDMTGKNPDSAEASIVFRRRGQGGTKRACQALKSPSAGKGLEGPEELHLEIQQTAVDDVLDVYCTRISKQFFFFQPDVGVNSKTTTLESTARQVSRLPMRRQQRGMIALTEQNKVFDPADDAETVNFLPDDYFVGCIRCCVLSGVPVSNFSLINHAR